MFSLSGLISSRYLFSKKSHSVINIISWVSCVAVGVPVAGMIILLSVFNGFEDLVKQMYNNFDADYVIESVDKTPFSAQELNLDSITQIQGVEAYSTLLDANVLLEYKDKQSVAVLRGVDSLYTEVIPMQEMVYRGEFRPKFGFVNQALVGQGLAYNLGVNVALYDKLTIYAPGDDRFSAMLPTGGFKSDNILPSGTFSLDAETDSRYVIVPLDFAQDLLSLQGDISSVVIKTNKSFDAKNFRAQLDSRFKIMSRYEQKAELYRIMTYEKWGIFLIIALVMLVASFSIVGSIVMLILDKKNDTRTLITLGATNALIRRIFVKEGMLIASFGACLGLVFGLGFCFAQQWLGFLTLPARTFVISAYPIIVSFLDVLIVVGVFFMINFVIAYSCVRLSFNGKR